MKENNIVCATIVFASLLGSWAVAAEDGFVSLFDGKTLTGWEGNAKDQHRSRFLCRDGMKPAQ